MTKTRATLLAVLLIPAFGQTPVPVVSFQIPAGVALGTTTTVTPWDSSEFSSASSNVPSGPSSGGSSSVDAPGSLGSFKWSSSGSLVQPYGSSRSSDSDMSNSASFTGSYTSGSSGLYLRIYQWFLILFLCCCCLGGIGGVAFMVKPQKPRKAPRNQERMPPPEPVMEHRQMEEAQPMVYEQQEPMPALEPLPTTSTLIPSYSQPYAAPPTQTYAMPMAPQQMFSSFPPQGYLTAPPQGYAGAQPATYSYAAQPTGYVGAQPSTYSYAAQPGGAFVFNP